MIKARKYLKENKSLGHSMSKIQVKFRDHKFKSMVEFKNPMDQKFIVMQKNSNENNNNNKNIDHGHDLKVINEGAICYEESP